MGGHHHQGPDQPEALFHQPDQDRRKLGVKIKVKLLRGSAEGDCYIQSVGGNFA